MVIETGCIARIVKKTNSSPGTETYMLEMLSRHVWKPNIAMLKTIQFSSSYC
jgi:hypothetical protein